MLEANLVIRKPEFNPTVTVDRGVDVLNKHFPGWQKKVDPINLETAGTLFYVVNAVCGGIEQFYNAVKCFSPGDPNYFHITKMSSPKDLNEVLIAHGFYEFLPEDVSEDEMPNDWQKKKEALRQEWKSRLYIDMQ